MTETVNSVINNPPLTKSDIARLESSAREGDSAAQLELGSWYIKNASPEISQPGLSLLKKAAKQGSKDAMCLLGDTYLLEMHKNTDHYKTGANWYRMAADAGSAAGQARLAYLYLTGVGILQDHKMAFHYYKKAAAQKYPGMLSNLAYMYSHGIGISRDEAEALSWYQQAATNGEPRGFYNLGLRYICGYKVEADHGKGLVFLEKASRLGYPGSKGLVDKLIVNLNQSQKEHVQKLALEIDTNVENGLNMDITHDMRIQLDSEIVNGIRCASNPKTEVVCWKPRVFKLHEFLTHDECDHLIDIAIRNSVKTEAEYGGQLGVKSFHNGLTTFFESPICDATFYNIEHRIEKTTWIPAEFGEEISVLCFEEGNDYPEHIDFFRLSEPGLAALYEEWGQRVITFLMYLCDVEEGGETVYLRAVDKKITPQKGMAIMHFNCLPTGEIDEHSLHAGLKVRKGEKWLARKAICERSRRLPAHELKSSPAQKSKIGQNQPCICGSGKKYKRCCGLKS